MDQKKQLESLLQAGSILHASLELPELLKRMMGIIAEVMESEQGFIHLVDPVTGELALQMAQGQAFAEGMGLRVEKDGAVSHAAGSGTPVLIEDAGKDPRWKSSGSGAQTAKSVLCVPMHHGHEMIGVIEVINRKEGRAFDFDDLRLFQGLSDICAAAIVNSRKYQSVAIENIKLKEKIEGVGLRIIGNSPAMQRIYAVIKKIAPTNSIVLITGESGTGKEMIAKAIHDLSQRKNGLFMPLNCGALPETLLESELFGHEKGAFTGADRARAGLFEEAKGGTVFLDEIGETTLSTQVKLLRVLQEGKVKRIGSNKEITVDARIISATNRDLEELLKEKKFREDLFYRLNVVRINVPALRQRHEDIPVLSEFFLRKSCEKLGKKLEGISPLVLRRFMVHDWKGNVRELENVVESAAAMSDGPYIEFVDLPHAFQDGEKEGLSALSFTNLTYEQASNEFEKYYFRTQLLLAGGDTKVAAERAKVSEKSVYRRKKEFGLE